MESSRFSKWIIFMIQESLLPNLLRKMNRCTRQDNPHTYTAIKTDNTNIHTNKHKRLNQPQPQSHLAIPPINPSFEGDTASSFSRRPRQPQRCHHRQLIGTARGSREVPMPSPSSSATTRKWYYNAEIYIYLYKKLGFRSFKNIFADIADCLEARSRGFILETTMRRNVMKHRLLFLKI